MRLRLYQVKIAIDPGHSGPYEPGACADSATSGCSDGNRGPSGLRALQANGDEVMLTRVGDIDDAGLIWRAEIANLWGADLFLNLHANSFTEPAARSTWRCGISRTAAAASGWPRRISAATPCGPDQIPENDNAAAHRVPMTMRTRTPPLPTRTVTRSGL